MLFGNQASAYGVPGYGGASGLQFGSDPLSRFAERTGGPQASDLTDPLNSATARQRYLEQNPDVARAVQDPDNPITARGHYQRYGRDEGREWPGAAPADATRNRQTPFVSSPDQVSGLGATAAPTHPAGRDPEDDLDNAIAQQLGFGQPTGGPGGSAAGLQGADSSSGGGGDLAARNTDLAAQVLQGVNAGDGGAGQTIPAQSAKRAPRSAYTTTASDVGGSPSSDYGFNAPGYGSFASTNTGNSGNTRRTGLSTATRGLTGGGAAGGFFG